jgi:hypothetical protein
LTTASLPILQSSNTAAITVLQQYVCIQHNVFLQVLWYAHQHHNEVGQMLPAASACMRVCSQLNAAVAKEDYAAAQQLKTQADVS